MNECLVTKLKGVVDNNNLPIYGTIRLKARTVTLGSMPAAQQGMTMTSIGSNTISVTGSGYFARTFEGLSDPAQRLTSLEITSAMGQQSLFFANGDYEIRISNKYQLGKLGQQWYSGALSTIALPHVVQVDLSELNYATGLFNLDFFRQGPDDFVGDFANLAHCTNINYIVSNGGGAYGDIAFLKDMVGLTRVDMTNEQADIYGDISALGNKPALTRIYMPLHNISGNIASLAGDTALDEINMPYNKLTGDVSSFANFSTLRIISLANNNIGGSVASLGSSLPNLTSFSCENVHTNVEKALNHITGDFTSFGYITTLRGLSLYGQRPGNTCSGAIEDFIAKQVSSGRTNYSDFRINDAHQYATFGGQYYKNQGGYGSLTWEGTTKYIYYTGTQDIATCTKIICKGVSASDIAAWEAAGKDVIVIS